MFHVLIRAEVINLKEHLRFTLKMPNCGAVGCTNHPTKNPNLSLHRLRVAAKYQEKRTAFRELMYLSRAF